MNTGKNKINSYKRHMLKKCPTCHKKHKLQTDYCSYECSNERADSQWFNHILSMFATSKLSEDELQVFVQTLLDLLRERLKNTDDWFFQNHLFKEVTDKLRKDQYWIEKLNGDRKEDK